MLKEVSDFSRIPPVEISTILQLDIGLLSFDHGISSKQIALKFFDHKFFAKGNRNNRILI